MLGLGNALTTGSTREQLYSLDLDGTGDYLLIHDHDNLDRGTDNFSVSFWTKITHEDIDDQSFISKRQGSSDFWRIRTVDGDNPGAGKIYVIGKGNGNTAFAITGGDVMDSFLDTWVHICVTIDRDGNGVIYVNGVTTTYGATTDISSGSSYNLDNTGDLEIGAFAGSGMEGNIDEVAIWDVALDAGAVLAIYNGGKPFNLNSNRGNYDNALDLEGYWKMGNGASDDKDYGVVFDQSYQIGPNLLTAPGFESSGNWVALPAGSETCEISTTRPRNGSKSWEFITDGSDLSKGVKTGDITVETDTIYRFSYWAYAPSTNDSTWVNISKVAGNAWVQLGRKRSYTGTSIDPDTWVRVVGYFRTASTGTSINILIGNGGAAGADGDVRYIDDVALEKLTPPTIGSNLVPESSFETVTGWTAITGGTSASNDTSAVDTSFSHSGSNSWKLVVNGVADATGQNNGIISTNYFTVEANTVYRVSWWSYCPSGNGSRYVQVGGSSSGTDWHRLGDTQAHNGDNIPADTWTKLTYYFRTSSGTDLKLKLTNGGSDGDADDIRWFDDIELVKIHGNPGVTSGNPVFSTDTAND